MTRFKRALVFVILLTISQHVYCQEFQFVEQSVNMKIDNGYFLVSGLYFIKGSPGEYTTITFPFPSGPAYGDIDSIHIFDVAKNVDIIPDELNDLAVNFTVKFDQSDKYLFQLYYRVKLLSNKAEYKFSLNEEAIKDLKKASFYFIAPTSLEAKRFTYPPMDTIFAGDNIVYFWVMYDFTPTENMAFRFTSE